MNILALAREEDETSAQAGLAEKDTATGSNAQVSSAATQTQGAAKRLEDMVKGRVEGPIPNQTLSQFLNRAHVHPIVKRCVMDKEVKVRMKKGVIILGLSCFMHAFSCQKKDPQFSWCIFASQYQIGIS